MNVAPSLKWNQQFASEPAWYKVILGEKKYSLQQCGDKLYVKLWSSSHGIAYFILFND